MVKIAVVANIVEEGRRKLHMETFPRQHARTRRFTIGAPRSFAIASKNNLVSFLQSSSGSDPVNKLWTLDPHSHHLQMLADPEHLLLNGGNHVLSKEEQSRRERDSCSLTSRTRASLASGFTPAISCANSSSSLTSGCTLLGHTRSIVSL